MTVNTGLMTADDLWELPDDGMRQELVRGELRTMPPRGLEQGGVTSVFDCALGTYVRGQKLGRAVVGDSGFMLAMNPDTVRASDLAFVRRDRLVDGRGPRGYFHGAPDLAVEIISPSDRYTDVDEKIEEWLEHGTRLVFVVDPRRQLVTVHRPGQLIVRLGLDDVLTGDDVVPGWSMAVRELFEQE